MNNLMNQIFVLSFDPAQTKLKLLLLVLVVSKFQAPSEQPELPTLILHDFVTPWLHVSISITLYHKD